MSAHNMLAQTLDRLGQAIVGGQHPPGSALPPEPLLGEALGVSRTVVREAVKSLVAKGLLSTGPKVGTRVLAPDHWNWLDPSVVTWHTATGLTRDFLREMQELRRTIEPAAVRMAAERATPADIERIETAFAGMKQAVEFGGDYVAHDLAFHQALLRAAGNRLMAQMSNALAALLRTSFVISTAKPHGPAESLPLHRAVLDAVIARQPEAAERAAQVLIDGAADDIEAVLASRRALPSLVGPPARLKGRAGNSRAATPRRTPAGAGKQHSPGR